MEAGPFRDLMQEMSITRRGFVVLSAAAAQAAPEFTFFTASQAALVTIIAEQIVPRDEDPGATDAGVIHYIDRQLAGPLKPFAPLYREGLAAFEPMRGMDFAAQTEFLKSVERKEHGDVAARLFAVLIDHTMQGFYGPPSDGGNRDAVSWKMLGVDHVLLGGHH
jgi:gluconate 2-dehydrogenase gamma chain